MRPIAPFLEQLAAADSPALDPAMRERFLERVRSDASALTREGSVHLTASGHVIDAPGEHVALVWHLKGQVWVQAGGHLEADDRGFEEAARREIAEETGLGDLERVGPGPAMLHQHELADAFGSCSAHWDVQYLFRTPLPAEHIPLHVSAESGEVRWVPIGDLPEGTVADLPHTLAQLAPLLNASP